MRGDVQECGGGNGVLLFEVANRGTQHMYFTNTDYFELGVHRDANMTVMDELRSVNQDAVVIPVLWMGNLLCSNRSLQGVLKA